MEILETRYAKTPDGLSIAYQIIGDGATDLVYVPGFASNLDTTGRIRGTPGSSAGSARSSASSFSTGGAGPYRA